MIICKESCNCYYNRKNFKGYTHLSAITTNDFTKKATPDANGSITCTIFMEIGINNRKHITALQRDYMTLITIYKTLTWNSSFYYYC